MSYTLVSRPSHSRHLQKLENHRKPINNPVINPITSDVFKEDKSLAQKSEDLNRISFLPLVINFLTIDRLVLKYF